MKLFEIDDDENDEDDDDDDDADASNWCIRWGSCFIILLVGSSTQS